MKLLLR